MRISDWSSDVCSSDLSARMDGLVVLGPAMRADVILDLTGKAGSRVSVVDRFYEGLDYRLIDLAYDDTILRDHRPDRAMALPANPPSEPDLSHAFRHDVVFKVGLNGGMLMKDMAGTMGDGAPGGLSGRMGGRGDGSKEG